MAKRPAQAHEEFVLTLGPPSWAYSFALQRTRGVKEPHSERQCLGCKAACLHLDRFRGPEVEARLYGERALVKAAASPQAKVSKGVASIIATKSRFGLWADLPAG